MRALVVPAAAFAALASASAPATHDVKHAATISAPFDDTWTALIDLFADHNWDIRTLEKASGLIATDWLRLSDIDRYADCGGSGIAARLGGQVRFTVRVKPDGDDASRVSVSTSFRERRQLGDNVGVVECTSLGVIETTIHREVDRRAATEEAHRQKGGE